jgi:two-component system sensor histidine kinase KdpD
VRQSAELKSALLAALSHDLKTPLTAITMAAGNLRASWANEAQRREQLDVVAAEVARLDRLFQNIVEMARIETGAIDAELEWVRSSDIIEAAVQQAQDELLRHPLDIDPGQPAEARVDPRLTSCALAHVLENAGRYSPPGSAVVIRAATDDAGLSISVRDHGPGISPADLPRLFERFFRGAGASRHAFGTGMGLAIARGLLDAQGGRIRVENAAGGGACFQLNVPAPTRVADADPPETP